MAIPRRNISVWFTSWEWCLKEPGWKAMAVRRQIVKAPDPSREGINGFFRTRDPGNATIRTASAFSPAWRMWTIGEDSDKPWAQEASQVYPPKALIRIVVPAPRRRPPMERRLKKIRAPSPIAEKLSASVGRPSSSRTRPRFGRHRRQVASPRQSKP